MEVAQNKTKHLLLSAAALAAAVLLVGGFTFVYRDFGFRGAAAVALLLSIPLVVTLRLRCRREGVRGRELVFLAALICVAGGGSVFVVETWYADGLDRYHAEDVRWAEFGRRFRLDPAFRDVQVHKSARKNIHWASGTVDSETDLARLHSLAAECGIERRRLDGPFVHSVSLFVRSRSGV